jgi:hypothetical protein
MEKQRINYTFIKGKAKEAPFSKNGERISFSILLDQVLDLVEKNPDIHQKGYANLMIVKRPEPDQYGNTHFVVESTFRPNPKVKEEKERAATSLAAADKASNSIETKKEAPSDDLPF